MSPAEGPPISPVSSAMTMPRPLDDVRPEQSHLIGKLALAAADYARREGFAQDGYRFVMNCREDAGQTVFHIHLHLLAGAPLGRFGTPG